MLTSHELIGFMNPERADHIVQFVFDSDKPLYKATLAAVADARKLRPVFFQKQPKLNRHKVMLETLSRPNMEPAAANFLRGWLMREQTALLIDFLDALGLEHEEGVLEDIPDAVEDEKLKSAVDTILEKHPQDIVVIYLNAFHSMNAQIWGNLDSMLKDDPRLQF